MYIKELDNTSFTLIFQMAKQATLSTIIDADLKRAVSQVAKSRGMKLCALIEYALREQLEDFLDGSVYEQRLNEETVAVKEVATYLAKLRKK